MKKFDRSLIPLKPDLMFERQLWAAGSRLVAGIDEAGRGALAGPVAAAAIILPAHMSMEQVLDGVRDSKEMSPDEREIWSKRLGCLAVSYGVGFASSQEIDRIGIVPATRLAVRRALALLCVSPQHLLVDFLVLPDIPIPQTSLVKGDARSLSIAAASVLAKAHRDEVMRQLDTQYTGYGFAAHKGYGTREHCRQIQQLGQTPIHRKSFRY